MDSSDKHVYSRREFGTLVAAGLPLALLQKKPNSRFGGVQIGVQSYSYRSIPDAEAILKAIADEGISEVELMSNHVEALLGAPAQGGFGGAGRGRGRGEMTPEEQAAARASMQARAEELRNWRKALTDDRIASVRRKFNDAGIDLRFLTFNMNVNSTTDDEIEYGFRMAKALGVKAITTSTQVSMAKRVAPFAEKHDMIVAFHGHDQVDRPDEVASEETFKQVMAASKKLWCNLDIGHYTAANGDPVAFIEKYHDRITNLHVKDRKKNHGPNMPFGQGDTPIKEVLQLLKKTRYDIPANIEFEYPGDPLVEVPKCVEYCRQALL